MREKLIELIANFRGCPDGRNPFEGDICIGCKYEHSVDCVNENLADHLIANGVTVQKKGEWIDKPTGAYGRWQTWCSACGQKSGIGGIESNRHKPFCPNCGAKMDGVTDG